MAWEAGSWTWEGSDVPFRRVVKVQLGDICYHEHILLGAGHGYPIRVPDQA